MVGVDDDLEVDDELGDPADLGDPLILSALLTAASDDDRHYIEALALEVTVFPDDEVDDGE